MTEQESYTGQEMCEIIVEAMKKIGIENPPTPEQIWNYSPTGELAEVFYLFDWAMITLGRREKSIYSLESLESLLGENSENSE